MAASAAVIVSIAAGSFSQALAQTPKAGGTVTFVVDREPVSLLPLTSTANSVQQVGPKIFEGLLTYDADLNPIAQLATEWAMSPDGLTYTFKLRPGVKWHDGKDFTSADVAFSLKRLKEVHPRNRVTFTNLSDVTTPDPLTAVVAFSKPAPYFLTALAASESPIMPQHIFGALDPAAPVTTDKVIGTGPFKFKELSTGSYLILDKNPDYWDAPKPYIDRLIVRFIQDPGARAAALETGEVDLGDSVVAPGDVDRIATVPTLGVEQITPAYPGLQRQLIFNLDKEATKNLKVREAIAHAIDLQGIVDIALFGQAQVSPSPISTTLTRYYDPAIQPHEVDLKLAESLLDEAGFKPGADGTRFTLKARYNATADARTAEYIKDSLSKIGIKVDIASTDLPTYVKSVYTDRDFDFILESLANVFDPTIGAQRIYWSKNFKVGLPYSNGAHYVNPRVDELLEAAAIEPDDAKRKEYFKEFQKIVYDEIPVINLYSPRNVIVHNKRVHDFLFGAHGTQNNFANIWVD